MCPYVYPYIGMCEYMDFRHLHTFLSVIVCFLEMSIFSKLLLLK